MQRGISQFISFRKGKKERARVRARVAERKGEKEKGGKGWKIRCFTQEKGLPRKE